MPPLDDTMPMFVADAVLDDDDDDDDVVVVVPFVCDEDTDDRCFGFSNSWYRWPIVKPLFIKQPLFNLNSFINLIYLFKFKVVNFNNKDFVLISLK